MKNPYDVIVEPMLTERSKAIAETDNKYLFRVARGAGKIEIRQAIEQIYPVKVTKVNTMNMQGKKKRMRYREGSRSSWKKAIVTLKQGDRIEFI